MALNALNIVRQEKQVAREELEELEVLEEVEEPELTVSSVINKLSIKNLIVKKKEKSEEKKEELIQLSHQEPKQTKKSMLSVGKVVINKKASEKPVEQKSVEEEPKQAFKKKVSIANMVVNNKTVNADDEITKGVTELILLAEMEKKSAKKLSMSYFFVDRDSDYLNHNTRSNRR